MQTVSRYFVLYGRDPERRWVIERGSLTITVPWWVGKENVVEDTEWQPFEHHRFGLGFVVHLGRWCVGAGAFERPLSDELWDEVEETAEWFDVDPEEIGRWRGGVEAGATTLGYDFQVARDEVAGPGGRSDPAAPGDDEYDPAQALG